MLRNDSNEIELLEKKLLVSAWRKSINALDEVPYGSSNFHMKRFINKFRGIL